jgi:hypothetical protein
LEDDDVGVDLDQLVDVEHTAGGEEHVAVRVASGGLEAGLEDPHRVVLGGDVGDHERLTVVVAGEIADAETGQHPHQGGALAQLLVAGGDHELAGRDPVLP